MELLLILIRKKFFNATYLIAIHLRCGLLFYFFCDSFNFLFNEKKIGKSMMYFDVKQSK